MTHDKVRQDFEAKCHSPKEGGFRLSIRRNLPPFDTEEYYEVRTQIAWIFYQAGRAAERAEIREKLGSDEMMEKVSGSICIVSSAAKKLLKDIAKILEVI